MNNEKEKDEEISIDFSKLTGFFKKKKKEELEKPKEKSVEEKKEPSEEPEIKKPEEKKRLEEQEEKEEEISINFGKIKNLFKTKPKEKTKKETVQEETTKEETTKEETSKEEISFDLKKFGSFVSKYKFLFLLLIPIFFSIFFRAYPLYLPATDDWARDSVYNSIRVEIEKQINEQYPFLPDANKEDLINKQFNIILEEQSEQIEQQIQQGSNYFKSEMQDENGHTYLLAIDPYLWYGYARNYLKNGHFGTEIVDGQPRHMLRNGRIGKEIDVILVHPFIEVQLYKILNFFNRDLTLLDIAFLVPLIIITLSLIPTFFIAKKIAGNLAGLFAAIIVAINASLLSRTIAGFSDTDAYQILFPMFAAWIFLEAFEAKTTLKMIIFAALSALLIGIFSLAWLGWWYILDFMIATLIIYLIYNLIIHIKEIKKGFLKLLSIPAIKNTLIILATIFLLSLVFVTLFTDFSNFSTGLTNPIGFIQFKGVAVKYIWPNVKTTVAEFNEPSLFDIVSVMGGKLLFFLSLLGITLSLTKKKKDISTLIFILSSSLWYLLLLSKWGLNRTTFTYLILLSLPIIIWIIINIWKKETKPDIKYAIFLTIWFIATIYASTKGMRFILLLVPAFAIAFGAAIGILYQYINKWIIKPFKLNKYLLKLIVILTLCLLLVSPIKTAHSTAKYGIPNMNDAWYEALTEIKDNSTDAIITSWWDFGHWFVTIAERRVTFDGADQGRRIHWVGKTLLTSNEEEAVGILRMLNCAQEEAPDVLDNYTNNSLESINILYKIILQDKKEAKKTLQSHGLSSEEADSVLKLTHCDDLIDQYFITSEDMVSKAGVWAHFGSWDFNRAAMYHDVKGKSQEKGIKILKEKYNLSSDESFNIYYEIQNNKMDRWVSGWPGYASGLSSCSQSEGFLRCDNGFLINLATNEAFFQTQQGLVHPKSFVFADEKGFQEIEYPGDTIPYSAALIRDGDDFKSISMSPELVSSMFTRLFFFNGYGLKHFKPFSYKRQFNGQVISVWKVDF